jgi:hypothetical protein
MLQQGGGVGQWAQMCTFAETANVDYRLSIADQGKQTSVFWFPLVLFPYI